MKPASSSIRKLCLAMVTIGLLSVSQGVRSQEMASEYGESTTIQVSRIYLKRYDEAALASPKLPNKAKKSSRPTEKTPNRKKASNTRQANQKAKTKTPETPATAKKHGAKNPPPRQINPPQSQHPRKTYVSNRFESIKQSKKLFDDLL